MHFLVHLSHGLKVNFCDPPSRLFVSLSAFTKTRNGTERDGTKWKRNATEQSINGTGENQTYGTEMIIMERNVLLQNVAPERDIVGLTWLSIIILNERS